MKATEYKYDDEHDELVDFLETDEGEQRMRELDAGWKEVMKLAEANGYICQAYGGVAILATHGAYGKENDLRAVAKRMRINNINL